MLSRACVQSPSIRFALVRIVLAAFFIASILASSSMASTIFFGSSDFVLTRTGHRRDRREPERLHYGPKVLRVVVVRIERHETSTINPASGARAS
jgi:hypothetical protein